MRLAHIVAFAVTATVTACANGPFGPVLADDGDFPRAALQRADAPAVVDLDGPKYQVTVRVLTGPHDNTPIGTFTYLQHAPFPTLEDCKKFIENDPEFRLSLPALSVIVARVVDANPGSVPELSCQPVGRKT